MSGAIVPVEGGAQLLEAARIHSASWQQSHRAFCSEAFVLAHTPERQKAYLEGELAQGKRLFMLMGEAGGEGIVTEHHGLIENLYVLPERQGRGAGRRLLAHACGLNERPTLWVLSNNARVIAWYERAGFRFTGRENRLSDTLREREMALCANSLAEGV